MGIRERIVIRNKNVFWIFIVLIVIYLVQSLLIPPDKSALLKYGLTVAEANLLELTITIPVIAIWLVAYYGFSRFNTYVRTVKDSAEGAALQRVRNGVLVMALWLPISSVISAITRYLYTRNHDLTAAMVILNNYVNLILTFTSMLLIYQGTKQLAQSNKKIGSWYYGKLLSVFLAAISIFYIYITLANPVRQHPSGDSLAAYYLPDWLSLTTVIIPYIFVFYFGFKAVEHVYAYQQHVRGIIYKAALKNIANGIGVTVLSIIGIRYLVSLNNVFNGATLKIVLAVIYGLILLIAIGYISMAIGAKKLQKIEEL